MRRAAFLAFLLSSFVAAAKPAGPSPSIEQYRLACKETLSWAQYFPAFKPQVGEIAYYPIGSISGLQSRFSFHRFVSTLEKAMIKNGLEWDSKKDRWRFAHDERKAAYGPKKRLTGIFYRGRIFIVDGHHRALVSLYTGAQTVPVHVLGDWSQKYSPDQFLEALQEQQYSYFRTARGQWTKPVDLCDMVDDPNLQLARFLIYRINAKMDGKKLLLENGRGAEKPVAVKLNQDIHFYEFEIADALSRAGVRFDTDRSETDLTRKELEEYASILRRAARDKNSRLRQILLLDSPTPVAKLDFAALIRSHLRQPGCEQKLMGVESDE